MFLVSQYSNWEARGQDQEGVQGDGLWLVKYQKYSIMNNWKLMF